jgi:hypothetical protein
MNAKSWYLIGMLALLFLANVAMLMGMTNWPQRTREGFAQAMAAGAVAKGKPMKPLSGTNVLAKKEGFATMLGSGAAMEPLDNIAPYAGLGWAAEQADQAAPFRGAPKKPSGVKAVEGFMDTLVGGGFGTAPIGTYDGQNMAAGLPPAAQGFRARLPNEPLAGPPVEVGPDNLFIFKNNQCKPDCCPATLSCDGGCVCSTPGQRDFINTRGGNRKHDDGF